MKRFLKLVCVMLCLMLTVQPVMASQAYRLPEIVDDILRTVDDSDHIYSYTEMMEDISSLARQFPEQITVSTLGVSVDGREIPQIVIGNSEAEHAVFVMASIHGREWMNTWILMESLELHLINWEGPALCGKTIGEVFENCCVYLVPMVNPDGVTISQYGLSAIQNEKLRTWLNTLPGANNPQKWKANANGVDLNRNFPTGWNSIQNATVPSSAFFNGYAPFTEPESIAICDALEQRHFDAAISYHSVEGAIYWDLNQDEYVRECAKILATHCKNITGYRFGEVSPWKGLEYNYMNVVKSIPSVIIETGTTSSPIAYEERQSIWEQNRYMLNAMAGCYQ